jgi:hypothetical protein
MRLSNGTQFSFNGHQYEVVSFQPIGEYDPAGYVVTDEDGNEDFIEALIAEGRASGTMTESQAQDHRHAYANSYF